MSIKKRLEKLKAQQGKQEPAKPAVPKPSVPTEGDKGLVEKAPVRAPAPQRKPPEDADSDALTKLQLPEDDPEDAAETRVRLPEDSESEVATKIEQKPRGKTAGEVIDSEDDLFAAMERASEPDGEASSGEQSIPELGSSEFSLLDGTSSGETREVSPSMIEGAESISEEPSGETQEVSPSMIEPLSGQMHEVTDSMVEDLPPESSAEPEGELDLDALAAQARSSVVKEKPQPPPAPVEKKTKTEGAFSAHWATTQAIGDRTKLRLGYTLVYTSQAGAAKEFTLLNPQGGAVALPEKTTAGFNLSPGEARTFENLQSKEGPLTITVAYAEKGMKVTVEGGISKGDKLTSALKKAGTFLADNSVTVIGMVTGTTAAVIGGVEGWLGPWLGQFDIAALAVATAVMDGLAILHIRDKYKRNDNVGEVKGE